ncbi:MAG: SIS domain-containing protein [Candidatus Aminicenantes bacterium]|nr:SIS domain-containing protein [Candidatus Aminicenantes bacterium]
MEEIKKLINTSIENSILVKTKILQSEEIISVIYDISIKIVEALYNGNKVFFAGNGGSHSDSLHLAGEFVSRFMFDRNAMPGIALGSNSSMLTAIGNDYSFDNIFSRELGSLGYEGDVLIAISTSGNSKNILELINTAKIMNINVFGLTGETGGEMKSLCTCICVPSEITARIQEVHIMIGHIICEIVEYKFFKK